MDGMNRTEILAFDYYQGIVAFTLDYQAQLLYWVLVDHYYYYYTNNVSIYSSTVDGTNIETVFRLNNDFYNNYYYYYGDIHLSLFEQRLFVSSSTELFVLEINEENVTTSTIVDRSLLCNSFYRHYLTIISENKQLQGEKLIIIKQ